MISGKTLGEALLTYATIAVAATAHAQSSVSAFISANGTTLYDSYQLGSAASVSYSWSGACTTCSGWDASATGEGHVTDGLLGDSISFTVTGTPPQTSSQGVPFSVAASTEAAYTDSLTVTGGSGGGVLALQYSIDGTLSSSVPSGAEVLLGLSVSPTGTEVSLNGAPYTIGYAREVEGSGPQNDILSFYIPFTYGSSFSIGPYLVSSGFYASGSTPFTADADFSDTMVLDSALIYAGTPAELGAQNYGADISSTSGLLYGSTGISPVPLPATAWLMLSGLGALGAVCRGRRRYSQWPHAGHWLPRHSELRL